MVDATDTRREMLQPAGSISRQQGWALFGLLVLALVAWLFFAQWPEWLNAVLISKKALSENCKPMLPPKPAAPLPMMTISGARPNWG